MLEIFKWYFIICGVWVNLCLFGLALWIWMSRHMFQDEAVRR